MADNTCDTCGVAYDYTRDNSVINLYAEAICNHIVTKCPSGHVERIYTSWRLINEHVATKNLKVTLAHVTPPDLLANARQAWERSAPRAAEAPKELEVPHPMLRELYDSMRDLGKGGLR